MGDAQSAQLEGKRDAEDEEEIGKVDDAQTEQNIEDQSLKNKGLISEINEKAESSTAEVNGHCEDEITAEVVLSPDEDVSQTEKPLKEETPLENVEINESPNEADANEDITLEMIEMDAKQNDINDSFRRFFSNIGLKLTVKRGSGEIPTDVTNDTDKEEPNRPEDVEDATKETTSENPEPNRPEDVEDATKETTSENAEQNTDMNIAQETYDNDSTTCPTPSDITSEDVLENVEEKATENKVEVESNNADAAMAAPRGEDANQDTTTEEEPRSTSPSSPEEEAVVSPMKRFFTTGIFSGLRKKKKLAEDETTDKEMKDIGENEVEENTEQTVQDQQQDKEDISLAVEAAAVETEHEENKLKEEILSAAQKMDASLDPSTIIVTEPEILSSQEKDKVQASPLKRLLSGSSLKKLSKKQRSRRSSDAKLSDSGEHVSDQFLSSTETAENQKEEGCAQPSTETVGEEDGAWASFKRLLTPKKRMKKSSLSNEERQIPGSIDEPKPSKGGQISDHSTEENKKRKDSSVSWDSVLCRSGRRRSRKTSDSDDETPQIDNDINKQEGGSKHGAESALENEIEEILAYSPKQAGSPSEGDGTSTWKSLKRLVTPKRKAKDDDESKDNVQSDSEVTQDESSFSIKKLLPGRKKRKSAEKQDQVSSDEADKEAASGDEDSDTPAVVPLSEFDTVETEVHIQSQAFIESHIPKEADFELQQDRLDPMAEPVLPCDNMQTEAKKVQGNEDASDNQATTTPATIEKSDDLTESISKQQLSDIPEEATPGSVTEDAVRDDTIAEDLIEITSEAITAPEHLDITLPDETEMISAVSQLSLDSSKTSGNTTPVPAEYVVEETDALLYQVVETISISPETVCSYKLRSERKVFSVSHQTLETFVKPTILELNRSLDTSEIHTGLKVEELDANNELAATTQIASIFEVNDSVSTELVSEVPTEEFDNAEITEDEVQEVDVTHPEDTVTELESIDESHYLVECLSEVNATTNKLPEGDEIVLYKGSLIEAHQTETEIPKLDSQEADLAATVADETKDMAMKQEVPSLEHKEDITDQTQAEDADQQLVEVKDLQELANVQALTLSSEEGVPSLEKDIISEGILAGETEVSVEPEKEDELNTDTAKPEHFQVPEASEVEQASTLDSEEGNVQSPKEEVKSEDILPAETVPDEPEQSAEVLTEISVELEKKEPPVNAMKTVQQPENIPERETDKPKEKSIPFTEANAGPVDASKTEDAQEPVILETLQAPTLDSEEGSVQSFEKEVISDNVPEVETVIDEPKQTVECLTEVSVDSENKELPANVIETVQEPDVFKAVQVQTLDSEEGSVQSHKKEVISENVTEGETDGPKEETIPLTEANPEPVDASKTEHAQEPEILETVQAPTLDSEEGSVQSFDKEVISDTVGETVIDEPKQSAEGLTEVSVDSENKELPANVKETVQEPEVSESVQAPTLDSEEVIGTDEPKEESIPLTEANPEPVDASKTEHVQELQAPEAVQAPTLDSEEGSVQSFEKEVISDTVGETVIDEPKQSAEGLTEVSVDSENKELPANVKETVQEPEVSESVHAPTLDPEEVIGHSLEKEVMSEIVPERETDEPKEKTIPFTEANAGPVDASKTEDAQEPVILETLQAPTLDSEEGSVQSFEKEVISDNVPEVETVIDEHKQTVECLTEVSVDSENKELPANVIETVQEPDVFKAVQVQTLDSEEGSVQSHKKEVISENVTEGETDGPKEETIPLTEANPEPVDASKTEHAQEPEILETVQAPTLDSEEGSVQSFDKEVISDTVGETVIDEPKQSAEGLTEVSVDSENKELPANVKETVQEPEVSESVQAPTLDSEEVIGTDEPKEESIPLTEANPEPVDASKTEHVQELQAPEAVQAPTLDSEEGSVQSFEKEVISDTVGETVIDEPKQSAEGLTEVSVDSENKELPANVKETVQEPEVSESVHAPTLDPEEVIGHSLEKEVMSEIVPERETDEPKEKTIPFTEADLEPLNASKTEHVQELQASEAVQAPTLYSEEGSVQSLEKEVISDNDPEAETVIDEPKHTAEHLHEVSVEPADSSKTEQVQELEVIQAVQAATLDSKVAILLSLDNKVVPEDISEVETVTDKPKQENEVEPDEKIPVEDANTEHAQDSEELPSDVKKHVTYEGTSMCMHVVTQSIEESSAQEYEKQILLDEVAKPNIDNAIASVIGGLHGEGVDQLDPSLKRAEDPEKESIAQDVGVEQEQCIHEVVDEWTFTEVCVSSVNEDASNVEVLENTVLTEDTPAPWVDNAAATNEPKHGVHLSALQVNVEGEKESELSGTEIKTAGDEYAVVAQVVICDIKDVSAEIPGVLIEKTLPNTEPLIERVLSEEVFKEEVETTVPLVMDDKAETAEEGSVVVMMHVPIVEFEDNNRIQVQVVNDDIKSAETIVDTALEVGITEDKEVIDVCHGNVEKVDNLSATLEIEEEIMNEQTKALLQKVTEHVKENLPETVPESLVANLGEEGIEQPDAVTKVSEMVESESSEVEDQKEMADSDAYVLERQDETSTVISDVAATGEQVTEVTFAPKDDLEETEAKEEASEAGVAVEEVNSNQSIHKETQMIQTPIGSVESPSSLSIEFQLNTQFGQENEPASPPPITERSEPVEKTDVSEVVGQAIEVLEPAKTIKQIAVTEVAVLATGITELAANLDSEERAVIMTQPVLLNIRIQVMEPEEQVEARERVTSSVQATDTMQPGSQTEKREVSQSQPALSEAYGQETKAEEPAKQKEEDQDVWMDAEEDVYTQEKCLGPQTESEQEGKAGLEHEVEIAPNSKIEEEESQQEMHKTVERRESDSEGEDFAVALEHPETEAVSVTTMERN